MTQAGSSPTVNAKGLIAAINASPQLVTASVHHADLILTAKRLGPLQLRWRIGHPETNILNQQIPVSAVQALLFSPSMLGILVSWGLLSLSRRLFWLRFRFAKPK